MLRFNHMELTFPPGTLTPEFRTEVDAFYGPVFGFQGLDTEVVGQLAHLLLTGAGQFILLAEGERHIHSPGYDHLGFLFDTRVEVDGLLVRCKEHRARDPRVQIKEYEDLVTGCSTQRYCGGGDSAASSPQGTPATGCIATSHGPPSTTDAIWGSVAHDSSRARTRQVISSGRPDASQLGTLRQRPTAPRLQPGGVPHGRHALLASSDTLRASITKPGCRSSMRRTSRSPFSSSATSRNA